MTEQRSILTVLKEVLSWPMMAFQRCALFGFKLFERIFGKIFKVFVLIPHENSIGNSAEEILFALLYAKRTKRKLILLRRLTLFGSPNICNKELFNLESPYILGGVFGKLVHCSGNLFLTIVFGFIPAAWRYLVLNSINIFSFLVKWSVKSLLGRGSEEKLNYVEYQYCFFDNSMNVESVLASNESINWKKELTEPLSVRLNSRKAKQAEATLRQMGLGNNDWFVCLHVRDGGFWGDSHSQRNASVKNYIEAIKAITAEGGWVIRLGDNRMEKLPEMPKVIDYPFTDFKSEFMDLYLIEKCRLYIGQNSGLLDVAYLFQKQCVAVNMSEWAITFPTQKNSLAIFKHYYSNKDEKFFSIEEMMKMPMASMYLGPQACDPNLTAFENTPEEIKDVVMEALHQNGDYQYTSLQEEFLVKRQAQTDFWLSGEEFFKGDTSILSRYRVMSRASAQGTVGRKFLEAHWTQNQRRKD